MEKFDELLGLYERSLINFHKANVHNNDEEFYSAFLEYKKCVEDLSSYVRDLIRENESVNKRSIEIQEIFTQE